MKRLKTLLPALALSLFLFSATANATTYDCLQFRVVGVCIWIICTIFGCDISVTVKYGHFNPDVLVRVNNPQGVNRVEDPKRTDTHNRNHNNLIFQDAWAVGHPLTGRIYCPSITSAGSSYFFSQLDSFAWRYPGLDSLTPGALIPGIHEIGNWPSNVWGHLYPRNGWTTQASEPKSSAVVAQRVGDIITRRNQPHVYRNIVGPFMTVKNNKIVWNPSELVENSNEEGWFQMMQPKLEQCTVFGEDDRASLREWGGGRKSKDGVYYYALWRPYTCCDVDSGVLIVIDFIPYPFPVIKN